MFRDGFIIVVSVRFALSAALTAGVGLMLQAGLVGCEDESIPPLPPESSFVEEPAREAPLFPPPPADMAMARIPTPPHEGWLVRIEGTSGYVEWVVDSDGCSGIADTVVARAYFLDSEGKPLQGVRNASFWVATTQGPRRLHFVECNDVAYRDACMKATLRGDLGKSVDMFNGVIRFELDGTMRRVVIPRKPAETLPAGVTNAGTEPAF